MTERHEQLVEILAAQSPVDSAGKVVAKQEVRVNAAVEAALMVKSTSDKFNPLKLADALGRLAKVMVDATNGVEGISLGEDDIFEEE